MRVVWIEVVDGPKRGDLDNRDGCIESMLEAIATGLFGALRSGI